MRHWATVAWAVWPRASWIPWQPRASRATATACAIATASSSRRCVNGSQVEATDEWLTHGYPWEVRRQDKVVTIKFGGHVEGFEENGRTFYRTVDAQDILAVLMTSPSWAMPARPSTSCAFGPPSRSSTSITEAFNRGDYALADAERAEAEAISAILYPNDAGEHGRLLRLKQEYLFVSAGIYSLLETFEKGTALTGSCCRSLWPSIPTIRTRHVRTRAHAHPHR